MSASVAETEVRESSGTLLVPPDDRPGPPTSSAFLGNDRLWLALSLVFALLCGIGGLRQAFFAPYVVQDDARTFVFWMERFTEPGLFPNDLMAAYFAAVSPPGYTALHRVAATVFGVDPFLLNKTLPMVLGLIMTVYAYATCRQLLRVPAAAFAAATILNESVWRADSIPSGTPRAFIYPIFLAFLYYSLRKQRVAVLFTVGLMGLFYPQMTTIMLGTLCLGLLRWEGRWPRLSADRGAWAVCISAIVLAVGIVAIALQQSARFGPVVTADEARKMVEFTFAGRTSYFTNDWWRFWIVGERSGVFPYGFDPPFIWLGALLPVLAVRSSRIPLLKGLSPGTSLLTRVTLASFGMYALAHLLIFRLHLPSRYTQHSLRMVMSLAAGIVLVVIVNSIAEYVRTSSILARLTVPRKLPLVEALFVLSVVSYPGIMWLVGGEFPLTQYLIGREADLYRYVEQQPPDIMIASLSQEADLIPSFARRSIVTGYEYGIPYHQGYYSVIRQRMHDLVRAEYSTDPLEVRGFTQRYGVTHWLINRQSYSPVYVRFNRWIGQTQPEGMIAQDTLDAGQTPALAEVADRCTVFRNARFLLVDAKCVVAALPT